MFDREELTAKNVPDNANALYQLLLHDFNISRAVQFWEINPPEYILMRNRINIPPIFDMWSEDEVRLFEEGIALFGKTFHTIRAKLLPNRTVAQLVEFYYFWKMTDRYREIRAQRMELKGFDDDQVAFSHDIVTRTYMKAMASEYFEPYCWLLFMCFFIYICSRNVSISTNIGNRFIISQTTTTPHL